MRDDWSTLKKLMWLRARGGGTPSEETTISGNLPLSFNAVAKKLKSLVRYGLCTQDGTPSPTTPVDIKCNGGTVGIVSEGVPEEYIRVQYLESSGTQYIDTGIVPTADLESEAEWMSGVRLGVYGARWSGSPRNDTYGVYRAVNSSTTTAAITFYFGNYSGGEYATVGTTENVSTFRTKIGLSEVSANSATAAISRNPIDTDLTIYAFAFNVSGTPSFGGTIRIHSLRFTRAGETVANFLPCKRRSDGVLGMYDTVSGAFKTNAGTGTFTAGSAIGYAGVVGTPEVVSLGGKNLFDAEHFGWSQDNTIVYVPIYLGAGTYTMSSNRQYTTTADVFFFAGRVTTGASTAGNGVFSGQSITVNSTDGYVTIASRYNSVSRPVPPSDDHWQIERGSTATAYEPYHTPQTASVETLLGVPANGTRHDAFFDEQNIITGSITRKCGMIVLNGTENWSWDGATHQCDPGNMYKANTRTLGMFSTHFPVISDGRSWNSTPENSMFCIAGGRLGLRNNTWNSEQFKAWLSEQYVAGTPVIVVYPLHTPTTESVTGQNLSAIVGTNTLSSVSNLSSVTGEITFYGAATPSDVVIDYENITMDNDGCYYADLPAWTPTVGNSYRAEMSTNASYVYPTGEVTLKASLNRQGVLTLQADGDPDWWLEFGNGSYPDKVVLYGTTFFGGEVVTLVVHNS